MSQAWGAERHRYDKTVCDLQEHLVAILRMQIGPMLGSRTHECPLEGAGLQHPKVAACVHFSTSLQMYRQRGLHGCSLSSQITVKNQLRWNAAIQTHTLHAAQRRCVRCSASAPETSEAPQLAHSRPAPTPPPPGGGGNVIKRFTRAVEKKLSNLQLAIAELAALAGLSSIGTVIEQNQVRDVALFRSSCAWR